LIYPDYNGGSIANLMASLGHGLGGTENGYPLLEGVDLSGLTRARKVLLLVIDGLGYRYLLEQAPRFTLFRHCVASITSVCPSTTASAIPTFLTGFPPQQHGLTGWFTYFPELGNVLAILPYRSRLGYMPIADAVLSPRSLAGVGSLFSRLPVTSHIIMPDRIAHSSFNRAFCQGARIWPYSGLSGLSQGILRVVAEGEERSFVYAYWPEFDALAHEHGVASRQVADHLQEIDRCIQQLLAELRGTDTLVLITADHGFVDTRADTTVRLSDHPLLAETLMTPLCGEPRLAYCYVHPNRTKQFERYVAEHLSDQAELFPSTQLLEEGWFGLGNPHARLRDRIGHYALVMKGDFKITGELPGEAPLQHIGVHGGLSPEEMYVPLILVEN
jgi:hypothetical protein